MKTVAAALFGLGLYAEVPDFSKQGSVSISVLRYSSKDIAGRLPGSVVGTPLDITGIMLTACTENRATRELRLRLSYRATDGAIVRQAINLGDLHDMGALACASKLIKVDRSAIVSAVIEEWSAVSSADFAIGQ